MWSTWVKGATLLLLVVALVEARKEGCVCGGLGSGSNPCSCNEVVVKAAKLSKPLQYASPEAINEAAALRESGKSPLIAALQTNSASNSQNGVFVNTNSQSSSSLASVVYGAADTEVVPASPGPNSNGDCGCGRKKPASLQVQDILNINPNAKIVPNFSPIGDLCTEDKHGSELKSDVRVKVTPAYPGKLKCCEGAPYEECVKIIQGIRGGPSRLIDVSRGGPSRLFDVSRGVYNGNFAINGNQWNHGNLEVNGNFGNNGNLDSNFGTPIGQINSNIASGAYGSDSSVSYDATAFFDGINEGGYVGGPSQSRPLDRLPADPISLTLAYKNIVAPAIYYKKGKQAVSEGGLSFGHRTIPTEVKNEKKTPDIPEEKLLTVDKPIVELKISPPNPLTIGNSNDDEEDLAELEAMERENLDQREQVDRVTSSFLSYGDVGYAPINTAVSRPIVTINPPSANVESLPNRVQYGGVSTGCSGAGAGYGPEAACGPLGPPLDDYVPGNIVLQREYVEPEEPREPEQTDVVYNDDASIASDEDIDDGPGAGIIARLRNSARNYGGSSLYSH